MTTKVCPKCKIEKDISMFSKNKCTKDGYQWCCRDCRSIKTKEKREAEEKRMLLFALGFKICSVCHAIKPVRMFYKHKDSIDGLYYACKECYKKFERKGYVKYHREYGRKYRELNRDRVNETARRAAKSRKAKERLNRLKKDITYKIIHTLRQRLYYSVKLQKGNKQPTLGLLGCSTEEFKKYLETLFTGGMTWDNYGKNGWHIDHIIPCAAFDLTDPEQQRKCFHYTNLQPLWASDNQKKSSYYKNKMYRINKK